MRPFKRSKELAPELVPGNATAAFLDICDAPFQPGDPIIGLDDEYPEWVTPEEAARREAAIPPSPPIEELMKDPNVIFMLEVARGLVPVPDYAETY